jgi:hypothetical protein
MSPSSEDAVANEVIELGTADGGYEAGLGSGWYRVPHCRHVSESPDKAELIVPGQASGLEPVS